MGMSDFRQRIGSLHNGISTQSASSRFSSQLEDAENALFSVVNGVSTRGGTRYFAGMSGVFDSTQMYRTHKIIRDGAERYMVVYGKGSSTNGTVIRVLDLTNPRNRIQYLTVEAGSTFTLTFGGVTTSQLTSSSTAADVQTALAALSSIGSGNVAVTLTGTTFTVVLADSLPTIGLITATASAGSVAVVGNVITPTFIGTSKTGYLNSGSPTSDELRMLTIVDTTIIVNTKVATGAISAPIGASGASVANTQIDPAKFPVKMVRTSLAPPTFTVSFYTAQSELKYALFQTNVTASNPQATAPKPFLAGNTITDIAYHRGRICLAMNDSVVCSQPGDLFNFFPFTILGANDADAITVQIGSNAVSFIDFMVPFRKSLLIFTRSGTQFELGGDETFTGTNATFTPSTSYATQKVRPAPVSSMIYMAGTREDSSNIYEYVYDDIQVSNRANNVTNHVQGLLPQVIRTIIGSDNNDTLVVVPKPTATDPTATISSNGMGGGFWSNSSTWSTTEAPTVLNTVEVKSGDTLIFDKYANTDGVLFIYKQMRSADRVVQAAWSRYSFGSDIIHDAVSIEDTMYILRMHTVNSVNYLVVDSMPLSIDPSPPPAFQEQPRLDHRYVFKGGTYANGNTTWTIPYGDNEIDTVAYTDNGRWKEYPVTVAINGVVTATGINLSSGTVVLGRAIPFLLTFSRLYQLDDQGQPIIEGQLEVTKVVTDHYKCGPYKITASSSGRSTRTTRFAPDVANDFDYQGRFSAWCTGRSNDLVIRVENIDSRPVILTGIEYYGRHTSLVTKGSAQ